MVCMGQLQFNNRHILFSNSRDFEYIKVVNGNIQYFVKLQKVKRNKCYKFRNEIGKM